MAEAVLMYLTPYILFTPYAQMAGVMLAFWWVV